MRRNGLSKYDAPLRIQFEWGYAAFKSLFVKSEINEMSITRWIVAWIGTPCSISGNGWDATL